MHRKSGSIPVNPITRDKIEICRKCEVYKICTIPISQIPTSEYCISKIKGDKV